MSRLLISRRAERQLQRLPGEVRVHLETHLENLASLLGSPLPLAQVLARLERGEEGFTTTVEGMRLSFALDTVLRVILVHNIAPASEKELRAPDTVSLHSGA
ncbi:hypothetical protein JY651_11060 [Pyxidicoccus parkwayensis]|uniref:Uncharacterized protein n=1 Tax=Pyxidicoccus parkwayensis TaxID=2813578 RepID=A0ABX7P4M2_9BACT|nr:hypothetical protein [Pyxidicoccus parkwaysis]QSQ25424.1 hypothetical protein JY651_11060 [Pyxidicoccus parkwaysis]